MLPGFTPTAQRFRTVRTRFAARIHHVWCHLGLLTHLRKPKYIKRSVEGQSTYILTLAAQPRCLMSLDPVEQPSTALNAQIPELEAELSESRNRAKQLAKERDNLQKHLHELLVQHDTITMALRRDY